MKKDSITLKSGGLIAIALLILAEYVAFPWLDWVESTRISVLSQQNMLVKQERLINKAKYLELQRDSLETSYIDKLTHLQKVGKDQDSAIMWLNEVETQLASYSLTVNHKSPNREVDINSDVAVFTGRVNVKGEYAEVLSFIAKLENYQVGNRVRQLRLTSNKATPNFVTADVEFLKVFNRL